MEVRPGYKVTEFGVIPEEWEAGGLCDFWKVTDCKHVTAEFVSQGFPVVSIMEVQSRFVDLSNAKHTTPHFYTLLVEGGRKPLPGDMILSRNATVGEVAQVAEWHPPFAMGQDVCLLRKRSGDFSTEFLQAVFQSSIIASQLANLMVGSTFKRANIEQIRNFRVLMPSPREQREIARALGDVDSLLDGLDRLIAKKCDLKQAAMQQLLTGQTRLPGFFGEWKTEPLKGAAEISAGINKPLSEMGNGALYVTVQDLYDGTTIRTRKLGRISVSPAEIASKALAVGDVVFGKSSVKREGIGYPSQFMGCGEPVVFSGFTYRARARPGITDARFLFYALRDEKTRRWLIDNSQASALTNINQTIADAIPIKLPPTVHEQTAIATVLSDMDAEIDALAARRDKTRLLKQAMMQELLTGKTRLI